MNKLLNSALASSIAAATALARPILQPEVKEYRALGGEFAAGALPVFHQAQRQCEIAAGETGEKGGTTVWDGKGAAAKGVYIAVAGTEGGNLLAGEFGLDVPAREQGYAVAARDGRVAIVGRDPAGTLYGAVTYAQMARGGRCGNAVVRDWPDYLYRGGMSIGRSLWYLGNGDATRTEGIKAGLDMMLRMKLNVIYDYFWPTFHQDLKSENVRSFWTEVTRYAEERGIYPNDMDRMMYVCNEKDKPEWVKEFKDWPCVKIHEPWTDYYYCWADDTLTERAAERYADYLDGLGFGSGKSHIDIHPVDGGSWQDPELWSGRCAKCRARWGDGERWKASVNQYNIWAKVLKRRFPQARIYASVYPYSFGTLGMPAEKRTDKWRKSTVEYWKHVDEGVEDKDFSFCSWIYTRDVLKEVRKLMPSRPFTISEPYPESAGLFVTFHRKIGSAFESDVPNRISLRGSDSKPKWESVALFAEYAWNTEAPGAEPYDGSTFYDPLVDHTGPQAVMDAHLYRICVAYWGEELAPFMERVMASGVMPGYIENAGASVKYWNSLRKDPLFDPNVKKSADLVSRATPITDSTAMMRDQAEKAEKCLAALKEASAHLGGIDRFKRKYFMRMMKMAPFWVAAAKVQASVRAANDALYSGDSATAVKVVEEGRASAKACYDEAEAAIEALKDEPAAFETWRPGLDWKLDRKWADALLDRAEASAKVTLMPRKIGKKVKVGIVGSKGAGMLEFFGGFENVEAEAAASLDLGELDRFDCVFVRSDAYDKELFFRNLRAYAERGGGGVWLEGDICGHQRFDVKTPFPDIVETAPERVDNFERKMKFADGREGETMYVDYFALKPGAKGEVVATSANGTPIAVRGECGFGKVFFFGSYSSASVANTYAAEPRKLFGCNAELAKEAVEWFTGVRLIEKQ